MSNAFYYICKLLELTKEEEVLLSPLLQQIDYEKFLAYISYGFFYDYKESYMFLNFVFNYFKLEENYFVPNYAKTISDELSIYKQIKTTLEKHRLNKQLEQQQKIKLKKAINLVFNMINNKGISNGK